MPDIFVGSYFRLHVEILQMMSSVLYLKQVINGYCPRIPYFITTILHFTSAREPEPRVCFNLLIGPPGEPHTRIGKTRKPMI